MNLETRMLNVVRTNPVPAAATGKKYKAALNRLSKKGFVVFSTRTGCWEPSHKIKIMFHCKNV